MVSAARSAEVQLATWDEVDAAGRVWTIATERMKAKREHRIPLCGRAIEILAAARALGEGSDLVFPMRSGRSIAGSTRPKMLQHHGIATVAHGFRSSIRDWAAERTDHRREVIEAALAHVVPVDPPAATGAGVSSTTSSTRFAAPACSRILAREFDRNHTPPALCPQGNTPVVAGLIAVPGNRSRSELRRVCCRERPQ